MNTILLVHFLACAYLCGVIWIVQILVYPNFLIFSDSTFKRFHKFHSDRITLVVAPAMLLELGTGIVLFFYERQNFYFWNLVSIFTIWLLTAFVSVPIHNRLQHEPESVILKRRLVWTNFPRTLLWSGRLLGLLWLMTQKMGASGN